MPTKKPTIAALAALILIATSIFLVTGCGGVNPTPATDLSVAARQTVAVILTGTAQAKPTEELVIPTAAVTDSPAPVAATAATATQPASTNQPAENTAPPKMETPGAVPVEPTRVVVYETPNSSMTQEPYHDATVEPTKAQ